MRALRRCSLVFARTLLVVLCTAVVTGVLVAPAFGGPDVDATFGVGGRWAANVDRGPSEARAVALTPDGKLVVAGMSTGRLSEFAVARYHPDGTLDTSFSQDGRVTVDLGGQYSPSGAFAVAVQPDGKVVAAGTTAMPYGDFALARFTTDGALDPAFSGDGIQTTSFRPEGGGAYFGALAAEVIVLGDGRILAGGPDNGRFALARYLPDGSPDPSLAGGGKVTTAVPAGAGLPAGMAVQPNGRIVVAAGDGNDFTVGRLLAGGTPDPSFSGDGVLTTDFGVADAATSVAVQPDGAIVVAGETGGVNLRDLALARYLADGTLDPAFSGDGKLLVDVGTCCERAGKIALQPDGAIVLSGTGNGGALVARFTGAGVPDTTFSGDGFETALVGGLGSGARTNAALVLADGRIVTVGTSRSSGDFLVLRHTTGGTLESTVTTPFAGPDRGSAVALQPDGKIVMAGRTGSLDLAVARFTTEGRPDPTFSGDGVQALGLSVGGTGAHEGRAGIALQADGRILVAGTRGFNVGRLTANGALDPTFDGDGLASAAFLSSLDEAAAVAVQPDGRIVVAGGTRSLPTDDRFAVARFNADGSPDPTFSGDGKVTTDVVAGPWAEGATSVAIQSDGRIVVAGAGPGGAAIIRYLPDGTLDPSFSGDGIATVPIGSLRHATSLALQSDGRIVVAGGGSSRVAVARLSAAGDLDPSFAGGGIANAELGPEVTVAAVALEADGMILVAGGRNGDFALTRFRPDGSLASTRSTDLFGGAHDEAGGIVVGPDGRVVVAGTAQTDSLDFGVVRYTMSPDPVPPPPGGGSGPPLVTLPAPAFGKRATVSVLSGRVLVRRPGSKKFVRLTGAASIPNGSLVDARQGVVRLTAGRPGGKTESLRIRAGRFKFVEKAKQGVLTDLILQGGSFRGCPKAGKASIAAGGKKKPRRRLWTDGKGKFRATGRYGSATVRGTNWMTADRCDGTLVQVRSGSVTVRDFARKRNVTVKRGRSYLARAKR